PLLPTRRRFWERALRAIDKAGKAGVLRTQLKIVHEAARSVADEPVGHVIGGDFVFRSESASMLQSGVLLKEIDELIRGLEDGTPDGELKSRACALVFLISQLPHEGVGDTGVRATSAVLSDLLVEDLAADGAQLRKDVPRIMEELVEQGRVMKLGEEFRLQTEEGAEWTQEFNQRRSSIRADAARMSQLRNDWLQRSVDAELAGLKLVHGKSKTPRKLDRHWGDDEPTADGSTVPVWIRDEWGVAEAKVREAAAAAGNDSPTVFVLLPKIDAEAIADTLASYAAAADTMSQRPEPQTDEGRQAKQGMQSRVLEGDQRLQSLFGVVIAKARVFQGGGNEILGTDLQDMTLEAATNALQRLYPQFHIADHAGWPKVYEKAQKGAPDALKSVGDDGEPAKNPVCKAILAFIAGGKKGIDIRKNFEGATYGWPGDAVDGGLQVLLVAGLIRAQDDKGQTIDPKDLERKVIGKTMFKVESATVSAAQRIQIRKVLQKVGLTAKQGEELAHVPQFLVSAQELANRAGGDAPRPARPATTTLEEIRLTAGNEQLLALYNQRDELSAAIDTWTDLAERIDKRIPAWNTLKRLLAQANGLSGAEVLVAQVTHLEQQRQLL
ncbi:MAG: BREX system P-loop protein BrxC, partial [Anaerolineae bacterium]|nr:BREX system P-loop protein BrxC [Anaerolineae bacterium]